MSMDKVESYSAAASSSSMAPGAPAYAPVPEYSDQQQHMQQLMKARAPPFTVPQHRSHGGPSSSLMVDYTLNNNFNHQQQEQNTLLAGFSDVMQFADFGPKLGLNQSKMSSDDETGIDPVYFLKFPVLNDKLEEEGGEQLLGVGEGEPAGADQVGFEKSVVAAATAAPGDQAAAAVSGKNKRKRGRAVKTTEEVESQRMTHIAVERNRRKQMNEHLRVLRSLMPGSYVQRGDQASIIGGSIEFVRELEQLLQCLESQKRRRLYGDNPSNSNPATRQIGGGVMGDATTVTGLVQQQQQHPMMFPPPNCLSNVPGDHQTGFDAAVDQEEEIAENKSCLADVEVKVLGFDAMIKILSRRRPGQLIRTIAALEDLKLVIMHTNITTIEQTVLYSFNVKVSSETRYSAEDIASSVQQIFSFIHAHTS
uniref:BHLH domain-containing protein n=2 Tax=Kalanchoe fedtschenkoi TaxID=63787 RepID=A0A7N1A2F4_KALFE